MKLQLYIRLNCCLDIFCVFMLGVRACRLCQKTIWQLHLVPALAESRSSQRDVQVWQSVAFLCLVSSAHNSIFRKGLKRNSVAVCRRSIVLGCTSVVDIFSTHSYMYAYSLGVRARENANPFADWIFAVAAEGAWRRQSFIPLFSERALKPPRLMAFSPQHSWRGNNASAPIHAQPTPPWTLPVSAACMMHLHPSFCLHHPFLGCSCAEWRSAEAPRDPRALPHPARIRVRRVSKPLWAPIDTSVVSVLVRVADSRWGNRKPAPTTNK